MEHEERLKAALADRYEVERQIGSGGMATVYLAHDRKNNRPVAIKVLDPALSQTLAGERFLREIRTVANLTHPHILPLHDSGVADGLLFYVMPFVEGESLGARLEKEKKLPLDQAVLITKEIADALAYAHEAGVIHRDVKPANILLSAGHAVLADFGLAQALIAAESGDATLTRPGFSPGTPSYMSPEQASGDGPIDGRTDQYALGCVLHEMLAGEPLFKGSSGRQILAKHISEKPIKVGHFRDGIPEALQRTILRALEKEPANRFQSIKEFSDALPIGLGPPGPAHWVFRLVEAIRDRWAYRTALGYLALVVLATELLERAYGNSPGFPVAELTVFFAALTPLVAGFAWALDPGVPAREKGSGSHNRFWKLVRWRGGRLILSGLLSVFLLALLWPNGTTTGTEPPRPAGERLAILYFQTPGGEEDLGYFARQLTHELIGIFTEIQRASGLGVFSANAVAESLSRERPGIEIARDLGADYVVDGAVIQVGDSVVVQVSLEDPETGQQTWREEVRESAASSWELPLIQAVADDLGNQLRRRVGAAIREEEIQLGTANPEAYQRLLEAERGFARARQRMIGPSSGEVLPGFDRSTEVFESVIGLDPEWIEPYVSVGEVAYLKALFLTEMRDPREPERALEALDEGLEALQRALERSPENPQALAKRGKLLFSWGSITSDPSEARRTLQEAEESLEAAVDRAPYFAEALGTLSSLHLQKGQYPDARATGERALERDAFLDKATQVKGTLAVALLNLGEDEAAISRCREVQESSEDYVGFECELEVMAWGDATRPDPEAAIALKDTILLLGAYDRQPSFQPRVHFALAGVYGRAGMLEKAQEEIEEARSCCPEALVLWQEAAAQVRIGDHQRAISVLERLLDHDPAQAWTVYRRVFQPLQDDPGFQALLSDHLGV